MIYIVTCGSYSDYRIEACFSSRELAEKFVEAAGSGSQWNQLEIEEWELNPFEQNINNGLVPFFGRISENGEISDLSRTSNTDKDHGFDINNNMYANVWARDEDHARKILAERHAVVKSDGWPKKRK